MEVRDLRNKIIFYIKKAWAPTVVVTAIFLIEYFIFGMGNTMIAPFAALTFLRVHQMKHDFSCLIKNFSVYIIMACLASVALLNVWLCIIVNALALFWIAYLLIDEFAPNNYFTAGMALIFFQISPVMLDSPKGLLMRIGGLVAAFFVIAAFLGLLRLWDKITKKPQMDKLQQLIQEGLTLCEGLCDLFDNELFNIEEIQKHQHDLCKINRQLCQNLYTQNRSALGNEVRDNQYCAYVALFQTAGHLISEDDAAQLRDLLKDYDNSIKHLPKEVSHKLHIRTNRLDIRSFRLRFALRQVCIIMPCLVFAYVSGWPNSYWLTISVFFMMIPLYERTSDRIAQRMTGTLAGLMLCVVLFAIFKGVSARIVLMTIFNFLIYCAGSYASMVTFITGSALALNFVEENYLVMLGQRLIYTIVGAAIAWAANTWVFPIRAKRQMKFIEEILEEIRRDADKALALPRAQRICELNRLAMLSYMLGMRMDDLNSTLPKEKQNHALEQELQVHMRALADCFASKLI